MSLRVSLVLSLVAFRQNASPGAESPGPLWILSAEFMLLNPDGFTTLRI